MAKKQQQRNQERVALNFEEVKRKFPWISNIGTARNKIAGTKYTMRITYNRTRTRIKDFDKQRREFDKYITNFYAKMNNKATTVWEHDCAIVAIY